MKTSSKLRRVRRKIAKALKKCGIGTYEKADDGMNYGFGISTKSYRQPDGTAGIAFHLSIAPDLQTVTLAMPNAFPVARDHPNFGAALQTALLVQSQMKTGRIDYYEQTGSLGLHWTVDLAGTRFPARFQRTLGALMATLEMRHAEIANAISTGEVRALDPMFAALSQLLGMMQSGNASGAQPPEPASTDNFSELLDQIFGTSSTPDQPASGPVPGADIEIDAELTALFGEPDQAKDDAA